MKNTIIYSLMFLILLILGRLSIQAEIRTWTDKKGNSIEAEFVNLIGRTVILRSVDGKKLKCPKSGFCHADQEYLNSVIPPKIDVDVSINRDKENAQKGPWGLPRKLEKIQGHVTLIKKNREPSKEEFTVRLYIIGIECKTEEHKLLSTFSKKFSFEFADKVEVSNEEISILWALNEGKKVWGKSYKGYLVIIEDRHGKIICIKANRKSIGNVAGKIRKEKKGARLDFLD